MTNYSLTENNHYRVSYAWSYLIFTQPYRWTYSPPISPWLQQQHVHGALTWAVPSAAQDSHWHSPSDGICPCPQPAPAEPAPTLDGIKSRLPDGEGGKVLGYTRLISPTSAVVLLLFRVPGPAAIPSRPTARTTSQVASLPQEHLFLVPTKHICAFACPSSNLRRASLICPFPLWKFTLVTL